MSATPVGYSNIAPVAKSTANETRPAMPNQVANAVAVAAGIIVPSAALVIVLPAVP